MRCKIINVNVFQISKWGIPSFFENLAKHFELQSRLEINELSDLPQYNYIKSALMRLQNNCVHTRKDIDDVENGVAIKA